jgi:hypothetical protein
MMLALVASSAFFNLPTIFCRPLSGGSFPLKIAQLDEKDRALCVRMSGRVIKNYKILQ